ncbi:FtsX-like permease family protein [Streptomyces sp. NPDC048606]|uniref:FtsX-like permease family protein n=1 Tax=Streptomyces sp. NPDC048606 TaxID=3154726 RepID=UPI003433A59E
MSTLRVWTRDLAMGARFAFGGGRQGWTRTLFTGVGVGLGVALLLISTAIPGALSARHDRADARSTLGSARVEAAGPDTLLVATVNQTYHRQDIEGLMLRAEGPRAPVPPGLRAIPGAGEMAVSPALGRLLASPEGTLLRERLDARIVETVSDAGLTGPAELLFYLGSDTLAAGGPGDYRTTRINAFAQADASRDLDPVLMLLVVLTFVALLMPVGVFVAGAVRFGGERRDQRLAALRLVGADALMVRRIAAGEALAGALVGLVLGVGFFLAGRALVGSFSFDQRSVFPADLDPAPWLALLVAVAVPVAAVAVTLLTLRRVTIEPLGVVRTTKARRRRIWWRLLLPLAGLGLLVPLTGRGNDHGRFGEWQVSGGVALLLVGITALLPWVLERIVGRLPGGSAPWQLAVRRLQVDSAGAARLVNGIAVAVAGAIALQMLFTGVEGEYERTTRQDPSRATISVLLHSGSESTIDTLAGELASAPGITRTVPLSTFRAARTPSSDGASLQVTVGTCDALREVAEIGSCAEGDAFALNGGPLPEPGERPIAAGDRLFAGNVGDYRAAGLPDQKPVQWTFPANPRTVAPREDPVGALREGLLVTPSAAPKALGFWQSAQIFVQADEALPDALDRARNAAFKADPFATAMTLRQTAPDDTYATIRVGLWFGATGVLILIGTSLLVSQLDQLRERRRLLAALVAFGTPRSTLALSVLWQAALPVALGLLLATGVGLALGATLLRMAARPAHVDWSSVAALTGAGAGMVALVTLLGLPVLLRLTRPDGLRTE